MTFLLNFERLFVLLGKGPARICLSKPMAVVAAQRLKPLLANLVVVGLNLAGCWAFSFSWLRTFSTFSHEIRSFNLYLSQSLKNETLLLAEKFA